MLFAGSTILRADDDCQKRTAKADHNLQEAIEHHGWPSPQAEHWRQELALARAYCSGNTVTAGGTKMGTAGTAITIGMITITTTITTDSPA